MEAVPVQQLRDEAVVCINNAIEYLTGHYPEYQILSSKSEGSWVCVTAESDATNIEFWWDVQEKHYILLGPKLLSNSRSVASKQNLDTEDLRGYGIEILVQFGGRRYPYMAYRKHPLIGVNALIEWVPGFVAGDWSRQCELEDFIQHEMNKRKSR